MAFYNYKRVVYRDDFKAAAEEFARQEGREWDGSTDYDGECWLVVELLLAKNDDTIARLRKIVADLFGLVESGALVRDTSHDGEPGFALQALDLVMKLKAAQEALSAAPAPSAKDGGGP